MSIWSKLQTLMIALPGWTARKRDFVFDGCLAWDDWKETKLVSGGKALPISGDTQALYRYPNGIEREYPGIASVCDQLQTMGCDKFMVTHVLKYLIENKRRHSLDQRMVQLGVGQKVTAALALDITGDSFVTYLKHGTKPTTSATVLPESMFGP